jgi:hypothetical protein
MQDWMPDSPRDVGNHLARVGLIPASIEILCHGTKLDNEVIGVVLGFGLAALLVPKAHKGPFILTHDNPGVRASEIRSSARQVLFSHHLAIAEPPFNVVPI